MNPDTGQIYNTPAEIKAALERGEPLVPVSQKFAARVERATNPRYLVRTLANIKRTRPDLSDAEQEALAVKIARRK